MKKIILSCAAVIAAFAAPVGAQFSPIGSPANDGGQFWDNLSADGAKCNSGFIVTKTMTGPCRSQRPDTWLPYTGDLVTQYYNDGTGGWKSFFFGPGSFKFSLLAGTGTLGGDVAGQNRDWGWVDLNTGVRTNFNSGDPLSSILPQTFTTADFWGLYIRMTNGNYAYSNADAQFAAFFAPTFAGYIFGMEDINVGKGLGSDRDYNDVMFKIEATDGRLEVVPEPATMTLLATGLAGMAAASRRRRNKK